MCNTMQGDMQKKHNTGTHHSIVHNRRLAVFAEIGQSSSSDFMNSALIGL